MKQLISMFSLLFPIALMAAPAPAPTPMPEGTYVFHDFSVQVKKRYESVDASVNQGRDRLQELQKNDYTCENKGRQVFLCSAFVDPKGAEAEIKAKVQKQLSSLPIEFLEATGEATLISEASVLTEWKIPQAVRFNGREHSFYFVIQTSNLEKLFLGHPAEETFLLDDSGNLNYSTLLTLTESKTSYLKYFVLAQYR